MNSLPLNDQIREIERNAYRYRDQLPISWHSADSKLNRHNFAKKKEVIKKTFFNILIIIILTKKEKNILMQQ